MADDQKKTDPQQPVTRSGKPPLTRQQLKQIVTTSVVVMVLFFGLNYWAMGQSLDAAVMWAMMMGAIAFTMTFGQVRRQQQQKK